MRSPHARASFLARARLFALASAPTLVSVALDLGRRGGAVSRFAPALLAQYLATALLSAALLGGLLVASTDARARVRWVARVLFAALFTVSLGVQAYFHHQYATYLNLDAALFGAAFQKTVWSLLLLDARALAAAHAAPLALSLLLLLAAKRAMPLRLLPPLALAMPLAALLAAGVLPIAYRGAQAAVPDIIVVHAVLGLGKARAGLASSGPQTLPGRRSPEYLPALVAEPRRRRNVVLVVTESVRADTFCSAYEPTCAFSPETNAVAPARLPLLQMRANDSATAVSVAVLLTGLSPTANREDLHAAPTLWEYAAAAGWDTAYWTSQNLLFGNSDMFVRDIGVDKRISATELDPAADLDIGSDDGELSAYVASELPRLREPYFAVVHYSNTHFPYLVKEEAKPFSPAAFTKDPEKNVELQNHYRNAVFLQDRAIAALFRAVRESSAGERTVVLFTSDHGEAFREHGQIGHTLSVYDEEIHVPAFVDAPPGTLTDTERSELIASRERAVFHTDIVPTVLDLVGLWEAPALGRARTRMPGTSLLRPPVAARVVPLTNCAAVWGCPFKNWGAMLGTRKLEAREWDASFHCFDLSLDPGEKRDLGAAACGDFLVETTRLFGGLPGASK